jgi:molybdopterin molybdotransferase
MRSFDLLSPAEAMAKFNAALDEARRHRNYLTETVLTTRAHNRVLAQDVLSPTPLPEFRRSSVDGYAVRAASTPGVLRVIGEVKMGEIASMRVGMGEAAQVHTGGHVPEGADAVLMVEQTTTLTVRDDEPSSLRFEDVRRRTTNEERATKIQTGNKLNIGENIIVAGEDLKKGDVAVIAGTRLREQEIAGLLSLGVTKIEVVKRPRVALIPSGDELINVELPTNLGQVRNTNQPMLAALVERNGGEPILFDILPDRREAFEVAAQRAMREADLIVFMASSSVGERDFVPDVVNAMGKPGIIAHGIRFRPGKPTLFAVCDGKPVFGLPGNPISALVTALLFVQPTLWRIQYATNTPQPNIIRARLSEDVKSPKDLEQWLPVKLSSENLTRGSQPIALPISTKSNLIFGLVRADGLVQIPIGIDRISAGTEIEIRLFD